MSNILQTCSQRDTKTDWRGKFNTSFFQVRVNSSSSKPFIRTPSATFVIERVNENVNDGAYVLTIENIEDFSIIALAVVKNAQRSLIGVETNDRTNYSFLCLDTVNDVVQKFRSINTETGPTDPENDAFVSIGEGIRQL